MQHQGLRRIGDIDSNFEIRSNEFQQYLLASGFKPDKVSKKFPDVANISREPARQSRVKMDFKVASFLTEFNRLLPDLHKLITTRLLLLYNGHKMKIAFPENSVKVIYRRGKNLNEVFPLDHFHQQKRI